MELGNGICEMGKYSFFGMINIWIFIGIEAPNKYIMSINSRELFMYIT